MTNNERAARAEAALDTYIAHTGDVTDDCHLQDLITDLLHLARKRSGKRGKAGQRKFAGEVLSMAMKSFDVEADNGWNEEVA